MPFQLITANGEVISADEGGPFQYTPEGFNSGLATNSMPLSEWGSGGGSYRKLYETQPWVAAAVNFLTRQIARLPLKVYERDSQNNPERVTEGPLFNLVETPAPRRGPLHLKQWLAFPTLLHGNSTVKKVRDRAGGTPRRLLPMYWPAMELKTEDDEPEGEPIAWISRQFRRTAVLDIDDVIHTSWHAPQGHLGVSPLKQLGVTLQIERAAQAWQQGHLRNAARPSGGVTLPEAAAGDVELRKELRSDLENLHQGGHNAGRPVIMPPGSKWEAFGHNAAEAELIDQRKLDREEIAAVYNAPQPLIGILDHATYSNIAELHKILYGPVLGPWLVLIEEGFKAQVIDGEPAFEGQWVEFDLKEMLKGEPLKEAMRLKNELQTGLRTINEARKVLNLPPIDHPDCNRPMIPANNIAFIGGEQPALDEPVKAVRTNLERLAERLYRKAKAGENGWDAARFHRELVTDLKQAGDEDPERTAKTWIGAVGAIVDDALNEPEQLKASFEALQLTSTNGGAH
jgi:HK97 family phage portal protein